MKKNYYVIKDGEQFPGVLEYDFTIVKKSKEAVLYRSNGKCWTSVGNHFGTASEAVSYIPTVQASLRREVIAGITAAIADKLYYELPFGLEASDRDAVLNALADSREPLSQLWSRIAEHVNKCRADRNKPLKEGVVYFDEEKTSGFNWWLLSHSANLEQFFEDHPAVGTGCEHDCSGRVFVREASVRSIRAKGVIVTQSWGTDI